MLRLRTFVALAASIIVGMVAACGGSRTMEPADVSLHLTNALTDSAVVIAYAAEAAHLVDPAPSFVVPATMRGVIAPGSHSDVSSNAITGFRSGESVQLFVYRVQNGVARYKQAMTVTWPDLVASGFQVQLTE
ncbi:MAG TPA: hypothetical protein VGM50_22465 [Gemmatimonadaceae bacterium]|jgi:hypothetical protein